MQTLAKNIAAHTQIITHNAGYGKITKETYQPLVPCIQDRVNHVFK